MLNISLESITSEINRSRFPALMMVETRKSSRVLRKLLVFAFGAMTLLLFVPWTQNIRSKGYLMTMRPDQRPQTVHSVIAGRIEAWYVKEGDFVQQGDTILRLSEVKTDYFDPELVDRTGDQLKSKELSVLAYMEKVKALDVQIDALSETSVLKLQQSRNKLAQAKLKVVGDSIELEAARTNMNIATEQYDRMKQLHAQGLKSLTDLETRRMKWQEAQARLVQAESQLLASENEAINAKVEINAIQTSYRESISKAESEKYSAMSGLYEAEISVTKMQNQFANYQMRAGMYFVTAPQDGYVTQTLQNGIGETIKDGDAIMTIMPDQHDLMVEMFVRPIDLPLVRLDQPVRIQFDGWPAIVFSGWPNTSYGTYGGRIYAVDRFISDNGLYRVLVAPDSNDVAWPSALRVGGGTQNMMLLQDVPIWYEIWRQINGFPPDFYAESNVMTDKSKGADQ